LIQQKFIERPRIPESAPQASWILAKTTAYPRENSANPACRMPICPLFLGRLRTIPPYPARITIEEPFRAILTPRVP